MPPYFLEYMNGSCTVTDFDTLSTELSQFWRCLSRRGTDTIIDTRTNTLPFPGSQGTLFIYLLIHSFIYEALCQASQLPMLLHIIEHTRVGTLIVATIYLQLIQN